MKKQIILKIISFTAIALILGMCFSTCKRSNANQPVRTYTATIKIKGSESEFNLIKYIGSEFNKKNPDINIVVAGGGSGDGIEDLLQDNIEIASLSRPVNNDELEVAERKGLVLVPIIIALDAIAIITNPQNGVDSLSLTQLGKIFNGTITNWNEVGGSNLLIKVYGRKSNSGTRQYLRDRLMISKYADNVIAKKGNDEILEIVKKEKGSIGYLSLGSIIDTNGKPYGGIWAVNTYYEGGKAHSPFEMEAIKSGEYPLVRPLYQYLIGFPKGNILDFIQFELSSTIQREIEQHGYFPINPIHKTINGKNIPDLNNSAD